MTHRSRLAGLIIDCETDDLPGAAAFWAAALGDAEVRAPEGRYQDLDDQAGLYAAVQQVEHPSRVHLDIESDDIPAEVARLERSGRGWSDVKTWTVMEAPTGHRFCVVGAKSADFERLAKTWPDAAEAS